MIESFVFEHWHVQHRRLRDQRMRLVRRLSLGCRKLNRSQAEADLKRHIWMGRLERESKLQRAAEEDRKRQVNYSIRLGDLGQRQIYLACAAATKSLVEKGGSDNAPVSYAGPEREILHRLGDGILLLEEALNMELAHWSMTYIRTVPEDFGNNIIRKLPAKRLARILDFEKDLILFERYISVWLVSNNIDEHSIRELLEELERPIQEMAADRVVILQKMVAHGFGDRVLTLLRSHSKSA